MLAGFAVELGPDDETLELPWSDESSGLTYCDLKRQSALLAQIDEANRFPELAELLSVLNAPASVFETAKCDVWTSTDMSAEDEVFDAAYKFGCYVDILFTEAVVRHSFSTHEEFVKRVAHLLRKVPDIPASAEFLIRRCYIHADGEIQDAFYVTFYLFGYGDEESQARRQWAIGMKLVENALRQVAKMNIILPTP